MHGAPQPSTAPTVIGRYAIYDAIASGGMATVHLGRLVGQAGFSRTVAIKRLHPALASDQDFCSMLLDEARLAARIQHPNVVPTLDVVLADGHILLVMEYVRGDSLSRLLQASRAANRRLPPNVVVAIIANTLAGLHAAHEATDERGQAMHLVHRDVSPQNIMVGVDGVARVLDFGIAKATGRIHTTREGEVKGKLLYMSREQLAGEAVSQSADIYAAGIILFEALTNTRMFVGENDVAAVSRIIANDIRVPSQVDPRLAPFDSIVRRASAGHPQNRYSSAREMARDLESVCTAAPTSVVGECVQTLASERLDHRARLVTEIERSNTHSRATFGAMPPREDLSTGPRAPTSGVIPTRAPAPAVLGPVAPLASQPVMAVAETARPSGSNVIVALALIIFMLFAGIGVGAIVLSRRAKAVAVTAPPVSVVPAVVEVAPPPKPAEVVTPLEPAAVAPSAVAPPAEHAKTPKARPRCDPPYTLDSKGHKHFIPECVP